jgi:hypothetical protein
MLEVHDPKTYWEEGQTAEGLRVRVEAREHTSRVTFTDAKKGMRIAPPPSPVRAPKNPEASEPSQISAENSKTFMGNSLHACRRDSFCAARTVRQCRA